jgi:hypothetical protein
LNPLAFFGPIALDTSDNIYLGVQGSISEITLNGTVSTVVTASQIQSPKDAVFDAVGRLYVSDGTANAVYLIFPQGSPLLSAILPGSRSVKVRVPAAVFSTILNLGNAVTNCLPTLPATAPGGLSVDYQTIDPTTNAVTGVLDQPVAIPANGGSQTFVLVFNAGAPVFAPTLRLVYSCQGVSPAPSIVGVNTVDLLFSPTPVPDIIAANATTDPGYVDIPGATGAGAFAVATANAPVP